MLNKAKLALALLTTAALGAGTLAAVASADERGGWHGRQGRGGMMMYFTERYDTNKDGKVTQVEIDTSRADWFARFDTDKDGKLSLKEYEALWLEEHRKRMVRAFQKLDPDGDAAITLEEYKAPLSHFVANRDRNGDGAVSKDDRGPGGKERWRRDRGPDDGRDGQKD